ncbi:MAG: hypothetical protein RBU37_18915 [Myxococcota bacterium]|jgi:hypothetical protein|nr:hypothetical protein [Myxococcota bacterium]
MYSALCRHLAATLCACVALASTAAIAQEANFVEVSPTQLEYNTQAVEALTAGDSAQAVLLMRSALALGEANVLYLNLGRALAQSGACAEALQAYQQALDAPKLASPTPEEIASIVERYREELVDCPARLFLRCNAAEIVVSIDGRDASVCTTDAIELSPGEHELRAQLGGQEQSHALTLAPGESQNLDLHFDATQQGWGALSTAGLIVGGVGVAALASSLILDLAVLGPAFDELEEAAQSGDAALYRERKDAVDGLQPINQGLLIGGGVLLLGGLTMWLVDGAFDDSGTAGQAWLSPDGFGYSWSLSW